MAAKSKLTARESANLTKIISLLRENAGGLWLREIARQAGMHEETVRRLLRKYPFLFEEYADFTSYKINLKIIKLKNKDMDVTNLERYISIAKKIGPSA